MERTVGAALRGRPAWNTVLCRRACCRDRVPRQPGRPSSLYRETTFHAGRPRRAAPTVRS